LEQLNNGGILKEFEDFARIWKKKNVLVIAWYDQQKKG
jgi:hypothetical protein